MSQINASCNIIKPQEIEKITIDNVKPVPLNKLIDRKSRITKVQANAFKQWLKDHPDLMELHAPEIANRYRDFSGITVSRAFVVNAKHSVSK